MSGRSSRAVVALAALVHGFAALAGAADSVKIVSASPMSGVFPVSPASGTVTVSYVLESAPYAVVWAGPSGPLPSGVESIPEALWKLQHGSPWVSKGTGQVTLSYTVVCGSETPPCQVTSLNAGLQAAQMLNGPLGAQLAFDLHATQGTLRCGTPPDITVPHRSGIVFGQKGVAWGASVTLTAADSAGCEKRDCAFEAAYEIVNRGGSVALPRFSSRLCLDTPANTLAEAPNLVLKKGAVQRIRAKLRLPPGTHTLLLLLDPAGTVAEANESNNQFQITYTLGATGGPFKVAPGRRL